MCECYELPLAAVFRRAAPLAMGNLAAKRDWGFAPDFVDGIRRIARQIDVRAEVIGQPPDLDRGSNYRDYVLGTGVLHAVVGGRRSRVPSGRSAARLGSGW